MILNHKMVITITINKEWKKYLGTMVYNYFIYLFLFHFYAIEEFEFQELTNLFNCKFEYKIFTYSKLR